MHIISPSITLALPLVNLHTPPTKASINMYTGYI